LIKRISKESKEVKGKHVKKWKHDLCDSLITRQARDKSEMTIFVENSSYNEVIKILKNYKIYIEEINDQKVVLRDPAYFDECFSLLSKEGLKVRRGK
jgi:hypothetical protein